MQLHAGCSHFLMSVAMSGTVHARVHAANPHTAPPVAPFVRVRGNTRCSMLAEVFLQAALTFLAREVPSWPGQNQCYSCHNNGDAARALYLGRKLGYTVPDEALQGTTAWLRTPTRWDEIHGAPAASDRNLARIQFTAALAE